MLCVLNSKIIPESKASIPINDSGFLYGYGIYEAIHVFGKSIWNLSAHLERLKKGTREIKLNFPENIAKLADSLVNENNLKESYLRIVLTENTFLITQKDYKTPTHVGKLITRRAERQIPCIKSTSLIESAIARKEAVKNNADDTLIIDHDGIVTEGAASNIFIVKDNELITSTTRALPGTTQKIVMNLAENCAQSTLRLHDIYNADEVFITSALKLIMPIGQIDDLTVGNGTMGPLTEKLKEKLHEKIRKDNGGSKRDAGFVQR